MHPNVHCSSVYSSQDMETMNMSFNRGMDKDVLCIHIEKEITTHCSTLFWDIQWTEEPGRLWSMGSQRIRHDWDWTHIFICVYTHTHVCVWAHTHSGMLLSNKKELNCAIFRDMDGSRDCHTEWSKSEREISYISIFVWDLEKWYSWNYLQSRNRDIDIENKYMNTKQGKWGWDELGDWDQHIYTTIYKMDY